MTDDSKQTPCMISVWYKEYGGLDKMIVDNSMPKPSTLKSNEVLVQMKSAGLNPVDNLIRQGYVKDWPQALPIITGWDISGIITEIGSDVKEWKVGDEVMSYNRPAYDGSEEEKKDEEVIGVDGCAAEFVRVKAWKLAKKPTNLSFAEAGGVPLGALTAHQGLFEKGGLEEGKTLLILNASGGVGSFAVQFAKAKGIKVVGTCSSRNTDFVKDLGAFDVVDYTKKNVVDDVKKIAGFEDGADIVFDCAGGDSSKDGIKAVKKDGGIIVSIVEFGIEAMATAEGKRGTAFVVSVSGNRLRKISTLIEDGKAKVANVTEFPLAEAKEAYKELEKGRTRGKIVLTN